MTIEDLRHALSARTRFYVQARPGDSQLLRGHGTVRALRPDSGNVIFDEAGLWTFEDCSNIAFHNIYSWSLQGRESDSQSLAFALRPERRRAFSGLHRGRWKRMGKRLPLRLRSRHL